MHKILQGNLLSFLWAKYLSVQLLDCVAGVCFILFYKRLPKSSPKWLYLFLFFNEKQQNQSNKQKTMDTLKTEFGV